MARWPDREIGRWGDREKQQQKKQERERNGEIVGERERERAIKLELQDGALYSLHRISVLKSLLNTYPKYSGTPESM